MPLLRFIMLFSFAALSIARAAPCSDFQIYANEKTINAPSGNSSVNYPIMIGENLEFKVSPAGDVIIWTKSGITVSDKSSYAPPISIGAIGNNTAQTMVLKVKNCVVEKTINIVLSPRTYTVTYDANGGTPNPKADTVLHGNKVSSPAAPPTTSPTGYEFSHWYENNENVAFDFINTPIMNNKTLKAKWKPRKYTITFDTQGGTLNPPISPQVTYNAQVGPLPTPTKIDSDFSGWYSAASGGDKYTATTVYKTAGNITLYARWELKKYKVTFNSDGGSAITEQTITHGNKAIEPNAPTKSGYNFYRWEITPGNAYYFSTTPVTSNITLKATWTPKQYTITFDHQNGTSTTSLLVTYNAPVGSLPAPTKANYDFSGWYSAVSGGTKYTETTVYQTAGNITLYARWTGKQYDITFDVNSTDGKVNPAKQFATYNSPVGTMPTPTRAAHKFIGWYSEKNGGTEYKTTTIYQNPGPVTLYAKWEFIKGTRPIAEMLDVKIPDKLVYIGAQITTLPTADQKPEVYGKFGTITILYDGKKTPPKDAGVYAISAFIDKHISGDYDSATISLGPMTIARATATSSIVSATAKSKTYDAKTTAEIDKANFKIKINSLYGSDVYLPSDYSIDANFVSPDVGSGITVKVAISWLPNNSLSKNYNISPSPIYTTTADIFQATGELRIIDQRFDKEPPFYEYTKEYTKPIVYKSPFIPDSVIKFEYKRDGEKDDAYSTNPPMRVGYWFIRATLPATANYTGAVDSNFFRVIRGNAKSVLHEIEFSEDYFTKDFDMSDKLRAYYLGDLCENRIKSTTIKITLTEERDIVLKLGNDSPRKQGDENLGYYYEIPFKFGKPGLDTLIYTLLSTDNIYSESDTLLIETPIPFDSITKQKWNNVIFINNNPKDNGGYEFVDFRWFENDSTVSNLQFYSAGPKSTDTLSSSDIYKITMHTKDGVRISTCEGSPKIKIIQTTRKPIVAKQVLGINGKTAKPEQKVYDVYGTQRKNTPAGVYIIKDK